MTKRIMFQGTGSNVGKSLLVSGVARALANRGLKVVPFKPQNMSNNAALTSDGGEIGRAQWLQAKAAKCAPSTDMNPVLLKPQSETGAQIVVQGRIWGTAEARGFQAVKAELMPYVLESFARLEASADVVLVEGAGSASEVNLRACDIANMGFARAADVPVVLVGDIDRGGVIASLVGTQAVLEAADAAMIKGFIVNKMRGDPGLFQAGMAFIAGRTGWAPLGLIPHFAEAWRLPSEDALDLAERCRTRSVRGGEGRVIAVPMMPRIANFDDLDPLSAEPGIDLRFVSPGDPLPAEAALVVLPGSKAAITDLACLKANGWDIDLKAHHRRGGRILGLCGGYQMLGKSIADPEGIEGQVGRAAGLGLLDVHTVLTRDKHLTEVAGITVADGLPFRGYEMHVGKTAGPGTAAPLVRFADGRFDGAVSPDGLIAGTYVHGVFADDVQRGAWLRRLGGEPTGPSYDATVEDVLDRLAAHVAAHVDLDHLLTL